MIRLPTALSFIVAALLCHSASGQSLQTTECLPTDVGFLADSGRQSTAIRVASVAGLDPDLGLSEIEWWYFDGPEFNEAEWVGWRLRHCEGNTEGWGVRTAWGQVVKSTDCNDGTHFLYCEGDSIEWSCNDFCRWFPVCTPDT